MNMRIMLAKRSCRQRGFTLIELAVVLTILALTFAIAAPSVTAMIVNAKTKSMADSIATGLQKARMEAMRRNAAVTFTLVSQNSAGDLDNSCAPSTMGGSWVVSVRTPDSLCGSQLGATTDPQLIDRRAGGEAGTKLSITTNAGATSVTFNSLGGISAGGLRDVFLAPVSTVEGARRFKVEMTAGGALRMCEPDAVATDVRRCIYENGVLPP